MKELYKALLLSKLKDNSKELLLRKIAKKIELDLEDITLEIKDNKISLEIISEKIKNIDFEIEYKQFLVKELQKESIDII